MFGGVWLPKFYRLDMALRLLLIDKLSRTIRELATDLDLDTLEVSDVTGLLNGVAALSGQASNTEGITVSIPPGSVLGPLLFPVFIDDVINIYENNLCLYARFSTVFSLRRSVEERDSIAASMNRDLERIKTWEDQWKVTFEPTKCKLW